MNKFLEEHPTGIAAAVAAGVVVVTQSEGWTHFSDTEAPVVVGAIAAVISIFTPRFRTN